MSTIDYLQPLLDEKILADQVRQAFNGMAALAVYKHMLSPLNESIAGTIIYNQSKVRVNLGTAAPVIDLLSACSVVILLLVFTTRPRNIVPRNPSSIGGVALLLHYSHELSGMLANSTLRTSQKRLRDEIFVAQESTNPCARFIIVREASHSNGPAAKETRSLPDTSTWEPMALKTWARILTIFLPVALIAALEVLQRISDSSDGITLVREGNAAHYGSTLVPALVLWVVSALYSSLHSNTTLLSPYHILERAMRQQTENCSPITSEIWPLLHWRLRFNKGILQLHLLRWLLFSAHS